MLDAELASLVWLLAERGMPLVVASTDRELAQQVRQAILALVLADHPSRDTIPGGVVIGSSLEDVLRVLGAAAGPAGELADETRDLGVVLVVDGGRLKVAHYIRPVERDAAGHLQRRPPAVLSARNSASGRLDQFYWAFTDELASRAGMTRDEFEREHEARAAGLAATDPGAGARNARH